jgi:hypothetical protein
MIVTLVICCVGVALALDFDTASVLKVFRTTDGGKVTIQTFAHQHIHNVWVVRISIENSLSNRQLSVGYANKKNSPFVIRMR